MENINWQIKKFDELTVHELYAILQLRSEVFIVEQNVAYQDLDDKDQKAHHLMCWKNKILIASCRILSPGISYSDSSIGRVITSKTCRGTGVGKLMMQRAIDFIHQKYEARDIRISAQLYLKKFYESFSFTPTSDVYIEDTIPHIEMLYQVQ